MSTQPPITLHSLIQSPAADKRLEDLLGKRKDKFVSALLQLSQMSNLAKCEPTSILNAAITAATLDLSISPSIGEAWIVPFWDKHSRTTLAQFQLGFKGFIALGHRTGKYVRMKAPAIDATQFQYFDPIEEKVHADFSIEPSGEIAGYMGEIRLSNGFKKVVWWPKEKLIEHAKTYSQTFKKSGKGLWLTHFDRMATKTVIKLLIDRWGPKSLELATAISADQSVQMQEGNYRYVDNEDVTRRDKTPRQLDEAKAKQSVAGHIESATTIEELYKIHRDDVDAMGLKDEYETKENELAKDAFADDENSGA
jgi:recombination protein RecT